MSYTTTLVTADPDKRLRRPGDLARGALALGVIIAVGLLAYVAQSTTSGIDQDITAGASRLPSFLVLVANLVSGFGALVFPIVASIDLIVRKRGRQLIESIGGLFVTMLVLSLASWALVKFGSDRLVMAFAGTKNRSVAVPFNILLGGLASFTTVAR